MLTKQNKQDIFALLLSRYPKKKAIPMEEVGQYLQENGLHFQEFGYQNMESLLGDLREFLELQIRAGKGRKEGTCLLHDYQEIHPPIRRTKVPPKPANKPNEKKRTNAPAETRKVPEKEIMDALFQNNLYQLGREYPLATLSQTLTQAGIDCHKYGFGKMKTMLKALPEDFQIRDVETNGVPQPFITILRTPKKETARKAPKKESAPTLLQMLEKEENVDFYVPDSLYLAFKEIASVGLDNQTIKKQLLEDYLAAAKAKGLEPRDDGVLFATRFQNREGERLFALLRRSDAKTAYRYFLNYIGPDRDKPKEYLWRMIHFSDFEKAIKSLAQLSRKEDWCYHNSKDRYIILKIYLQYTFYRLVTQGKIKVDEKSGFASFHTGLVTPDYEPIYAVLLKNQDKSLREDFIFQGFSVAGIQGYGKILVEHFSPLPEKATYIEDQNVLFLPENAPIHSDIPHILRDNLDRFPLSFLEKLCSPFEDIAKLVSQIKAERNESKKGRLYDSLSDKIQKNELCFNLLKTSLQMAIRKGVQMIRYDNHLLLPTFFPTRNVFSLMLPLCFERSDRVDGVLIIEKTPSGNYQGQTILTLKQSYVNSRLITPLDHSYLKASEIED